MSQLLIEKLELMSTLKKLYLLTLSLTIILMINQLDRKLIIFHLMIYVKIVLFKDSLHLKDLTILFIVS